MTPPPGPPGSPEEPLLLTRCTTCTTVRWYPRSHCPQCGARESETFPASGQGTIYTFTIVRRASGEFAAATPYVVAYVELAEGPRILTNIIDCDPEQIRIGQPATLTFTQSLYRFTPALA